MIVLWFILACLTSGAFGAALMAFLQIAKQADIADENELSLEQEEKVVYMTNADKLSKSLTKEQLGDRKVICPLIPDEHCERYNDCEQCRADWLRMEAEK